MGGLLESAGSYPFMQRQNISEISDFNDVWPNSGYCRADNAKIIKNAPYDSFWGIAYWFIIGDYCLQYAVSSNSFGYYIRFYDGGNGWSVWSKLALA